MSKSLSEQDLVYYLPLNENNAILSISSNFSAMIKSIAEIREQNYQWERLHPMGLLDPSQCAIMNVYFQQYSQSTKMASDASSIEICVKILKIICHAISTQFPPTSIVFNLILAIHDVLVHGIIPCDAIEEKESNNLMNFLLESLKSVNYKWQSLLIDKTLSLYFVIFCPLENEHEFVEFMGHTKPLIDDLFSHFHSLIYNPDNVEKQDIASIACQICSFLLQHIHQFKRYFCQNSFHVISCWYDLLQLKKPSATISHQLQYEILFCIWLISFDSEVSIALVRELNTVPILMDICKNAIKEKIIRICISIFRNMVEKAPNYNISIMIGSHLLELLSSTLSTKKYSDDEIMSDIQFVMKQLNDVYQTLSTFDEYISELGSGQLTWSPSHKSIAFWKQNVRKFKINDYEPLKRLVELASSNRSLTAQSIPKFSKSVHESSFQVKAIAAHDLGQFIKYYPDGRKALDDLGGKIVMMELLADSHPDVRYEALMALQKYMMNRW